MASCTSEEPVDNGNDNGNGIENGNDNGNGNENTEPNTEFSVEVAVLDYDNMTIKVTPPDDAPVYYALLYPDTENSLGLDDDALLESILTNTNYENFIFEGEQNLKYAGLVGHSHYRLVYFSYDDEFDLPFGLLYRSERITTPDGPKKFNIEVSDVTGMSANLKIVPEDPNMTYTYYVESMDNFQNTRNGSDYEQIRYDYNYWSFCAETYSQPIEEIIGSWLVTGTLDQTSYEFYGGLLEWDCEYMAYAYGVDTKGNMLTHMTKEVFCSYLCNLKCSI